MLGCLNACAAVKNANMIKLKRQRSRPEKALLPPLKSAAKRRPFALPFNTYLYICLAAITACVLFKLLVGSDIKFVYDDGQLSYTFRGSMLITPHGNEPTTSSKRPIISEQRELRANTERQTPAFQQQQGPAGITHAAPEAQPAPKPQAAPIQQQIPSDGSLSSVQPSAPSKGGLKVAIVNRHWWPSYWGDEWTDNCHDTTKPYSCHYVNLFSETSKLTEAARAQAAAQADALLYNLCPDLPRPAESRPGIPIIVNSAESSANYPCLDDADVMSKVSFEMSYRSCAQVQTYYFRKEMQDLAKLQTPPLPFSDKLNAVLDITSNCDARNRRTDIVRALTKQLEQKNKVKVHSFGKCNTNMGPEEQKALEAEGKVKFAQKYKFCLAFENSNDLDYVTEKVYQALEAGCIPIYYGAPNIADYVPDAQAIINLSILGSPAALAAQLEWLVSDKAAYEEKLAWKIRRLGQLSAGFQQLYKVSEGVFTERCHLCRLLIQNKRSPQPHTLCHANTTWQEHNAREVLKATAKVLDSLPASIAT